jgi:predicted nuclease with RNAse H fold
VTWSGVDVGGRRKGFHAAVVDRRGLVAGPVRLPSPDAVVTWLRPFASRVVAVDGPCSPALPGGRSRECERALAGAVCGIRYTPARAAMDANAYYAWILNGFELYDSLAGERSKVIECFPTASFTHWAGPRGSATRAAWSRSSLAERGFLDVPLGQDGRDAVAAALTARCYDEGSFVQFGPIVVPAAASATADRRSGRRSRDTGAGEQGGRSRRTRPRS